MTTIYMPFIDVTVNAIWNDWQNYPNGRPNSLYSKQVVNWNIDGLVFGFITLATTNNTPCWAAHPAMPLDWAKPLANDLNAAGKKVIISFGGAVNSDISTALSVNELIGTYETVIRSYSAAGLDFDLENGLYNVDRICQALVFIQRKYPDVSISFTVPTMPSGLTTTGLNIISKAVDHNLTFIVNGMAMDYYDPIYAPIMGKAANDAAVSIAHQLQEYYPSLDAKALFNKVAVTPMIGLNDDYSMFTLANAKEVGIFARQSGLAFMGSWSFNRDNPSSYEYVDLITSSNPEQKSSGEYSKNFL